jgi:zinc finger protein
MSEAADPSNPVREDALDVSCPVCGAPHLKMRSLALDLPYFGDALQTTVLCEACGFRHADILLTNQGSPTRHSLRVLGPSDLNARVVRSSSCTVRVPEIGAVMEPGPRSEAFISNAEGVLHRFRDIFGFLARNADSEPRRRAARDSLDTIARMIEGHEPFTLILDDPFGNSAILHESTEVRPLTDREVRSLKTGVFTIEVRPRKPRSPASR